MSDLGIWIIATIIFLLCTRRIKEWEEDAKIESESKHYNKILEERIEKGGGMVGGPDMTPWRLGQSLSFIIAVAYTIRFLYLLIFT